MTVRLKGALGVKIAGGAIVPVLDSSSQRLNQTVFTTVRDRQNKAVFDFYYRDEGTGGWVYLDSLPLSHIPPAPAGGPELRMRTQLDARGNLSLQIQDPAASKPFSFVLKADTLARKGQEVEAGSAPAETGPGLYAGAAASARASAPSLRSPAPEKGQQRVANSRRRWLLVLAPVAALLVASILLLDLNPVSLLRRSGTPMLKNVGAEQPTTRPSIDAPPAAIEAGVPDTSALQARNSASKAGDKSKYLITYGDTLWRITERFYGSRDLYPALADVNRLPDPDVIIAGKTLLIPPLLQEERASSSEEDRRSR